MGAGSYPLLIMLLLLLAMMWFTSSRQRKALKEREEFRNSLAPGDRVMTTSGLHANVVSMDDAADTVVLDAGHGPMTWSRSAIAKRIEIPLDQATTIDPTPITPIEGPSPEIYEGPATEI